MSILDVPLTCIPTINTTIFQFIWKNKKDKIKRQVMYKNYDKEGIRVPNAEVVAKSLRLAWIPRFYRMMRIGTRFGKQFQTIFSPCMVA